MIELKVDEYCHDCPEFVPASDKLFRSNNGKLETYTAAFCMNCNLCASIKGYLDERSEKDGKENGWYPPVQ